MFRPVAVACLGAAAFGMLVPNQGSLDIDALTASGPAQAVRVLVVAESLNRLVGGIADYSVKPGETLRGISARFGVETATLARENALQAGARLKSGQMLRINNRHIVPGALHSVELVVNVPQRMLFYRGVNGSTVGYPVAVGRPDWPTPSGTFVVTVLERHPTWEVPRSILEESRRKGQIQAPIVPPGPDNPLGDFWIGLSLTGIGIHATNKPSSIFRTVSHGCIRMHSDDIAEIFSRVRAGSPGRIIYEPVLLALQDGAIYLEVHRDVYGRGRPDSGAVVRALASAAGVSERVDWSTADAVTAARSGVAHEITKVAPVR